MWKRAVIAVVFALAITPAMASDSNALATALAPASCVPSGGRASDDVKHLSVRVASLEQRVERMGKPGSTGAEQQRAAVEERQAEFLKHVWTN
jgi:hypothetical protein